MLFFDGFLGPGPWLVSLWVLGSNPWLFYFRHGLLVRGSSNLLLTPWMFIVSSTTSSDFNTNFSFRITAAVQSMETTQF